MLTTALTILVPTFAVLLGVLFSRQEMMALRGEMGQLRSDLSKDMGQLRADMSKDMGQLRADMTRDMGQLRTDMTRDMTQLRVDINHDMTLLRDSIHRDMISLHWAGCRGGVETAGIAIRRRRGAWR